jgi:hypothetical protein
VTIPRNIVEPTPPATTEVVHEFPVADSISFVETAAGALNEQISAIKRGFIALKEIIAEDIRGQVKEVAGQLIIATCVAGVGTVTLFNKAKRDAKRGYGRMDGQPAGSPPLDSGYNATEEVQPYLQVSGRELRRLHRQANKDMKTAQAGRMATRGKDNAAYSKADQAYNVAFNQRNYIEIAAEERGIDL